MKKAFFIISLSLILLSKVNAIAATFNADKKILIFSLTKGFRHKSISNGIIAVKKLGSEHGFQVDTSESVSSFTKENLSRYRSIIFLNPTGSNVFNERQKQALVDYIHNGGGLLGIHAATDFCYEWEWYGKLIGAYFVSHPKVQSAKLITTKTHRQLMKKIPSEWQHTDEWYNFKSFNKQVKVLMQVDENSYEGAKMNGSHPIVWYHHFEGGRVFYTGLGHTPESYTNEVFLQQLLNAIEWTMGK
ncbi:ThuA domain-containing protein [Nubsella zeaxanthinifaciens]|uniref:ThuA domain-containing protein n=1 Tax=Nubsella zeaxanthinifaciens TaxID=392412 RepID=UPI003D05C085